MGIFKRIVKKEYPKVGDSIQKNIVIVGSVALGKRIGPHCGKVKDLDIVAKCKDAKDYFRLHGMPVSTPIDGGKKLVAESIYGAITIMEAEIAWDNSLAEVLMQLVMNDPSTIIEQEKDFTMYYPSLNFLYMLKMSHRYLRNSPHFLKTMSDIKLMRKHGAIIEDAHQQFYKDRRKETYHYGHPKLNVGKLDFFTDTDIYVYEHDDIHRAVAVDGTPAYTKYSIEGKDVQCSKELFFAAPERVRLLGGLEEAMVLALERSQIPNEWKPDPEKSFLKALEKVCTSITSGWFREYCWEHYGEIKELYDPNYVEKFRLAERDGKINKIAVKQHGGTPNV